MLRKGALRANTDPAKDFGNWLFEIRSSKQMTMRDVANKLNKPPATVSLVEKGLRVLKDKDVANWANALDFDYDAFVMHYLSAVKDSLNNPPITRKRKKVKHKVVISNAYGSGWSTAQGHMSDIHRYDLAESPTVIKAAEEGWEWSRLISALLVDGWDRGDIFDLNSYGWFPDGRPIVVEVEGPYQIHEYDGKEYIVTQTDGYWRH